MSFFKAHFCKSLCNFFQGARASAWHFRMVNDEIRNSAYRDAIAGVVREAEVKKVLDVGSGTGLLSLYAAETAATEIVACEANVEMAKLAQQIIEINGAEKRVRCYVVFYAIRFYCLFNYANIFLLTSIAITLNFASFNVASSKVQLSSSGL